MITGAIVVTRPPAQTTPAFGLVAGPPGKSAYQVWLDAGNTGPIGAYLASLIGPQGGVGQKGDKGDIGSTGPAAWALPVAWVTGTAYVASAPSSVIILGGETFVCLIAHTAGTFSSDLAAGRWVKVAAKGVDGTNGATGPQPWQTPPAAWATSTTYTATAPASTVTYNGSCYVCSTSHTSTASFDATKWTVVAQAGAPAAGALASANNLSDVTSVPLSRLNLLAASSDAQSTLAIDLAKARGKPLFPPGGIVDGFGSAAGYDTANSVNATLSAGTIINQALDTNTKALVHFDGADGSTAVPDAVSGHTWTLAGSAVISTAQSVFGGASLRLNAAGQYANAAASTDFGIGSGDFTFNLRVYPTQINGAWLIDTRASTGTNPGFSAYLNASGKVVLYATGGIILTSSASLTANTWTDIEIDRAGGTLRLYINGTFDSSVVDNTTYPTSQPIRIGNAISADATQLGYFDEFRFRNAYTRNTNANFTPATSAFVLGTSGLLDLRSIARALLVVPTRAVMVARVIRTAGPALNFGSGGNLTGSISRTGNVADGSALTFTQIDTDPLSGIITLRSAAVDLTGQTSAMILRGRLQTNDNALGVAIDGWDVRAVA